MNTAQEKVTGAEGVFWNLDDLCCSEAELLESLEPMVERARAFKDRHKGTIADLGASELAALLADLGSQYDDLGKAYTYAYLVWVTRTEDQAAGALLQRVKESHIKATKELLFVEVEWAQLPAATAEGLYNNPLMALYKHYLRVLFDNRVHILSEPEEIILSEKNITGRSAWNRFFDEHVSAMRFEFEGEEVSQQKILAKLHNPDRAVRKLAAQSFTDGLRKNSRTLGYVFNTILADKATDDRLRGYETWISSRNQSNQVDDASVERLIDAVTSRYDLSKRYYHLKRELLGYDEMMDYDRYAPLAEADEFVEWNRARDLVTESYNTFDPRLGEIVQRFFDEKWIDAAVVPGKRSGAFSHSAVPSVHPYILMNYTGRIRDVQTLAHELGHGVHQHLSRDQGIFHADTPLTTAETASVFGEMLVFRSMLESQTDPSSKLAMLVSKIDDSMATVFRQVTMNRFEDAIHTHRRERGELSVEDFCNHWIGTQQKMFGDSVTLTENYRYWWEYIPHFLHTPGYVYAYAFGELLVLALYNRYLEEGEGFSEKYVNLLTSGGSDYPDVLVSRVGVDLNDTGFWLGGLQEIEKLIDQAESLADSIKG